MFMWDLILIACVSVIFGYMLCALFSANGRNNDE